MCISILFIPFITPFNLLYNLILKTTFSIFYLEEKFPRFKKFFKLRIQFQRYYLIFSLILLISICIFVIFIYFLVYIIAIINTPLI
jgi:hypothetical protein